jgi:hypothetical protein
MRFVFDIRVGAGVHKREKKGCQSTLQVPGIPLKYFKTVQWLRTQAPPNPLAVIGSPLPIDNPGSIPVVIN